ncbi:MAG: transporter ATP-binding protein [Burkholderia sp.]|nr:transporter ATP-binding protein [Burkholderia sp.]
MSTQAALQLNGVAKSFGDLSVIQDATLAVHAGERHALIGPNGAGKSTLFNMISGRLSVSGGEILLGGRPVTNLEPDQLNRLGLGRSFQITNIFMKMSVFENVRIAVMARHGIRFSMFRMVSTLQRVNEETDRLMEAVALHRRRDELAGGLTYSEQRALELALTLATDPSVILLDEPTAGMSREETDYVTDLIRRMTTDRTLLMVEHDMSVVFGLCDRISVLVYGKILATGTPQEIQSNAEVQRAYLGDH